MNNKPIWLLTISYPPYNQDSIADYIYQTALMHQAMEENVTVFFADLMLDDITTESVEKNIRIVRFNPEKLRLKNNNLGEIANISFQFAEIVTDYIKKEGQPSIIEAHDCKGIAYFLLQRKHCLEENLQECNIIVTAIEPTFLTHKYNHTSPYQLPEYWTGEMERFTHVAADALIVTNDKLLSELKENGVERKENLVLLDLPFDVDQVKPLANKNEKDIYFIDELEYGSGVLNLIEQLRSLWDQGHDFKLVIKGKDQIYHAKNLSMVEWINKKYHKYIQQSNIVINRLSGECFSDLFDNERVLVVFPSKQKKSSYLSLKCVALGHNILVWEQNPMVTSISGYPTVSKYTDEVDLLEIIKQYVDNTFEHFSKNASKSLFENHKLQLIYEQKRLFLNGIDTSKNNIFPFIRQIKISGVSIEKNNCEVEKGLLSIVVPFYNMGSYAQETIDSIVKSTYENFEIIIIDDGSDQEQSLNVLNTLSEHPKVFVYTQKNQGLASARNFGARVAKGEFLAFLDADDLVAPQYYARAIEVLNYYENVSFVGCNAQNFGVNHEIWHTWNPEPPYILLHNTIPTSSLVFKKDVYAALGSNDTDMAYGMEDYEVLIRLLKHGIRGVSLPYEWFLYRVREDSMSKTFNKSNMIFMYHQILQKNQTFFQEYSLELIELLNANGAGWSIDAPDKNNNSYFDLYNQATKQMTQSLQELSKMHEDYQALTSLYGKKEEDYQALTSQYERLYADYIEINQLYKQKEDQFNTLMNEITQTNKLKD